MTQRSRIKIPNAHAATTSGTAISSFRSAPSRLPPTTQASVTSASVRQRAPNVNGRRSLGSGTSSVIGFPVRFRGAFPNPLRRRLASLASRPAEPNLPECRPTVEVLSAAGLRPRRPIQPGQHPAHLRRRPLAAPGRAGSNSAARLYMSRLTLLRIWGRMRERWFTTKPNYPLVIFSPKVVTIRIPIFLLY